MAITADHDDEPIERIESADIADDVREAAEIEQDRLIRSWRIRA